MRRASAVSAVALSVAFLTGCADAPTRPTVLEPETGRQLVVNEMGMVVGPPEAPSVGRNFPSFSVVTAASDVVLPNAMATQMGAGNNVYPQSYPNMRYQQIFLGSEIGSSRTLGALCLRPDDVFSSPFASQQTLTVRLGPTSLDPSTMGAAFDANYSGPPTTVFSGTVDLPATAPGGIGDWIGCVTFSTAYRYGGGNLIVEVVNTSPTFVAWPADACWSFLESGCNTSRTYAFSATAASGHVDVGFGVAMRLSEATPAQSFATLQSMVNALAASGALNGGQANSLLQQLAQALRKVQQGQPAVAASTLTAFVSHVSSLVADGVLSAAEGQPLIDLANALIAALGS